jgi:hypothetical protein
MGFEIRDYIIPIIFSLALVILAALLISLLMSLKKLRKQYTDLIAGASDKNVEQALLSYLEASRKLETRTSALEEKSENTQAEVATHLQNIGVVRYNAFEGVGGEQSFSLAILDDSGDGIALTGIFGHAETRVYAKPIEKGASKYLISPEENEAIAKARAKAGK